MWSNWKNCLRVVKLYTSFYNHLHLYLVVLCFLIAIYLKKCNQVVNTNYSAVHLAIRHCLNNLKLMVYIALTLDN